VWLSPSVRIASKIALRSELPAGGVYAFEWPKLGDKEKTSATIAPVAPAIQLRDRERLGKSLEDCIFSLRVWVLAI
jgi:hypothetical protein